MTITIPSITPSLNQTLREHWATKSRRKEQQSREIAVELLVNYTAAQRAAFTTPRRRKVKIHSQRKRKLDKDNLVGGSKTLVDALTKLRLIVDDSPEWVEIEYTQATGKPYGTRIEIN